MPTTNTPKFLIIAPAWVGDMIMAQPLYQLLKQQHPDCTIDLVAPKSTIALADRMVEIAQKITLPIGHGKLDIKQRWALGKSLRSEHYQQAFILPNTLKSALVPFAAKAKKRTGWLGEQRYILLNDHRKLDAQVLPLLVQRYTALAFAKHAELPDNLPNPKLTIDVTNQQHCVERLQLNLGQRPILALCPGGAYGPSKRWPATYFAQLAQHYLQQNWQVWIFGSPNEQEAAAAIMDATENQCINLCGQTNLLDAIDLLALADMVVTNDSGLMHIAAAVNTPLVAIYGSTSPGYTPPLADKSKILRLDLACSPCFKRECPLPGEAHMRCLLDIQPEQVVRAISELRS
jgi:heptosyltransferase-2